MKTYLENHQTGFTQLRSKLMRNSRILEVEMREYEYIPTMAGFHMKQPTQVCYVSLARWQPGEHSEKFTEYATDDFYYHRSFFDNPTSASGDIAEVFKALFHHCWSSTTDWILRVDKDGVHVRNGLPAPPPEVPRP